MINIKTSKDIMKLREGGQILADTLKKVAAKVKPGITTEELNDYATELILQAGAMPSFLGYDGFPASLCTSINSQIVHGVPDETKLKEGDIVGLDLGVLYPPENCATCPSAGGCGLEPGLFTDAAITVPVGKISQEAEKLVQVTKKSLELAIAQVKPGNHIGDIGSAIQQYVEAQGFLVIRDLVGHGVGHAVHEDPQIPNFGRSGQGEELKEGMVLAIEPMVSAGSYKIKKSKEVMGYAGYQTSDNSLSAHFEHTVVVTKTGAEILTK